MEEIWRIIEEAPNCEVSNLGNVRVKERTIVDVNGQIRTYKAHEILKNKKKTGYLEVALPIEKNKRIYRTVHRLVAIAFIPNPDNLPEVNHKDENKENNKVENLEWMESNENCNYGNRNSKIAEKAKRIKVMCVETGQIFNSKADAANFIGVKPSTINRAFKDEWRTSGGYHWKEIEVING